MNEEPYVCLQSTEELRTMLCGLKLSHVPQRSVVKLLSRAKTMELDVHEAAHFCETSQLPFRVQAIARTKFALSNLIRGTALVCDLAVSPSRVSSMEFIKELERNGYHTKGLVYDRANDAMVDRNGLRSILMLAKVLELATGGKKEMLYEQVEPPDYFDAVKLTHLMPSMSSSAGALIAHVMVGVAPEDYTPYLFLKKLESLELLTLHAELAASVQRELRACDLDALKHELSKFNGPGLHIMIGMSDDVRDHEGMFNFDLYGAQPAMPNHHFLVLWHSWDDAEIVEFKSRHRLPQQA